jgi:hypothetical protein
MDLFEATTFVLMVAMISVVAMWLGYGLWVSLKGLANKFWTSWDRKRRLRPLVGPWE